MQSNLGKCTSEVAVEPDYNGWNRFDSVESDRATANGRPRDAEVLVCLRNQERPGEAGVW